MKFIVDAQLPPRLAEELRSRGEEALAAREVGLREASDSEIWKYALENQAAILTKDEDFAERIHSSATPPIVIWLRKGNTSNRILLNWLLPLWPEIKRRIEAGDRLIEVQEAAIK